MFRAIGPSMWCASQGPNVSTPQMPYTALGTPANTSRQNPTPDETRIGSFSTITNAVATPMGTASAMAMAEEISVPTTKGSTP